MYGYNLEDFDVDLFLKIEDSEIYIYETDLSLIPTTAEFVPLGSFDREGKLKFVEIPKDNRIKIGKEFLKFDGYIKTAISDEDSNSEDYINLSLFYDRFKNIPVVTDFLNKYFDMCKNCTNCPEWCMECSENCPEYCESEFNQRCTIWVPLSVLSEDDLYFLIVVYFAGIYRTMPVQEQTPNFYDILTDVDFELNRYSLILNIKEFFIKEFQYFLQTTPGTIPFANDYGTILKHVVQTKNIIVRQIYVENEINFFITEFNRLYGDLVEMKKIQIKSLESDVGADKWIIQIIAEIKQKFLNNMSNVSGKSTTMFKVIT